MATTKAPKRKYSPPALIAQGFHRVSTAMFGLSDSQKLLMKLRPHICLEALTKGADVAELSVLHVRFSMGLELAPVFDQLETIDHILGNCLAMIAELAEEAADKNTRAIHITCENTIKLFSISLSMCDVIQDSCLRRELTDAMVASAKNSDAAQFYTKDEMKTIGYR